MKPTDHYINLFEKKFKKHEDDSCWIWEASFFKHNRGFKYGAFGVGKKTYPAHRFSYMAYIGDIPEKLLVCHTCDNPSCVNPKHLFLGTYKDNNIDKINKGRGGKKLTPEKIMEIRNATLSTRKIADVYSISQGTVMKILQRKIWTHVS